jgi:ATP-dependent Clp protease ATP-binding subunit ClpC
MFERFTERARSTIARAKHEAIRRRHNYIGTEHILLGVVGDADALAPKVLSALGFPPGDVVAAVDAVIAPGTIEPGEFIPFTPRAKQALELGLREALAIGHNYIGTEHILLGLLHEAEGIAGKVLIARGLTLEQVRAEVVRQLTALQGTA